VGKAGKALAKNQVKANRTKGPKIYAKLKKTKQTGSGWKKGTKVHTHTYAMQGPCPKRKC